VAVFLSGAILIIAKVLPKPDQIKILLDAAFQPANHVGK